ncbi:MAG: helix-turn-helix transcriptional regulator [Pseudobdellovibrionaceae bacterium]|nr:helix-turn-helix transcriptional regulator [Bdellovibrionales bacterium]USN47880.1 MAG: helix-turn-helix transcriptional regulator [Pseudobdellovibrionaceae bacterium]
MIKTDKEYSEAKERLEKEFQTIEGQKAKMKEAGMTKSQVKLATDPLLSFAFQLKEEVEEYEKLKRGDFAPIENLTGLGRSLVALRIFKGLKQKDLADRLGVSEAQVSRDERNEYHGASIERLQKVVEALNIKLTTEIELDFKDAM